MAKSRNPKGLGHYYKKDGLFCWKYVRDGKPLYRSHKTEKGLQAKVKKVIGLAVCNDKTKVSKYFETWLDEFVQAMNKKATYDQYKFIYKIHIKPVIGDYNMSSITTTDIQKVILEMNKKKYEKKDKAGKVIETKIGTSTKTMKHAKTVMNGAFTRAFKIDKIIPENPVKDILIPDKQPKKRKTLNTDELASFLTSLQGSRWLWSVKFALVTGVRRGELLALKWANIDWDNNRITIEESDSTSGLGDTKSARVHYVPLSQFGKVYLDKQLAMLLKEGNKVTIKETGEHFEPKELKKTDRLIFPKEIGEMVKPNTYYHMIVRYAKKSDIKVHPHCFRHTFVYNMRNKMSLKELQDALGHDESTTTLDIYGDMINDTTDAVASKIDMVYTGVEVNIANRQAENLAEKEAKEQAEECKVIDMFSRKKAN